MKTPLHLVLVAILAAHGHALAGETRKSVDVMSQPKFTELTKDMTPRERFETAAMMHIHLGQYDQAIALLEAVTEHHPKDAGAWMLLAIAYNRAGAPRDAFETANIAITLRPTYDAFLMERGIAAFQLGKDRQAVEDLSKFLDSYSNTPEAYLYLGLARARLGDSSSAEDNLHKARELNPALSLMTDYYLGLIAAQQGKTIEATAALKETLDAFKGVDSPMKAEIRKELKQLQGETKPPQKNASKEIRDAVKNSDAENAAKHTPRPTKR